MLSIPCKALECLPLELVFLKQQAHTVTMITVAVRREMVLTTMYIKWAQKPEINKIKYIIIRI